MSWQPAAEASCTHAEAASIELVIEGRAKDVGGLAVRRTLPVRERRHVGPFVFLDHMGPATLEAGKGIDVPPHPHIGLATVTWVIEGELLHRDSLGSAQTIVPGDVNWMSAGRGIVHSERTPAGARARLKTAHAIQAWVALPASAEDSEPTFQHHAASTIPVVRRDGVELHVIAGKAYGATSPVQVPSPLFYVDAAIPAGGELALPDDHEERALHVVEGTVGCEGRSFGPGILLVFKRGVAARIRSTTAARVMLLGGAPLDGERQIFWNFVATTKERIERAKSDWREGRFPKVPGDEHERVPLP